MGQLLLYAGRSATVFTEVGLLLLHTGRSAGDLHG